MNHRRGRAGQPVRSFLSLPRQLLPSPLRQSWVLPSPSSSRCRTSIDAAVEMVARPPPSSTAGPIGAHRFAPGEVSTAPSRILDFAGPKPHPDARLTPGFDMVITEAAPTVIRIVYVDRPGGEAGCPTWLTSCWRRGPITQPIGRSERTILRRRLRVHRHRRAVQVVMTNRFSALRKMCGVSRHQRAMRLRRTGKGGAAARPRCIPPVLAKRSGLFRQ
jgi:hypothetical protein